MMRKPTVLTLAFALLSSAAPSQAQGPVEVAVGGATILKADRDISALVSGNPEFAPANLIDSRTISVVGKKAGATVLVAVDEAGKEISRWAVQIGPREVTVRIIGLKDPASYLCNPLCTLIEPKGEGRSTTVIRDAEGNVTSTGTSIINSGQPR